MTGELDRRYGRLLRWYPRGWLHADRGVLLGMLLEDARAAGRRRPSAAECASIALHGLAERITLRAGRIAAVAAAVIAVITAGLFFVSASVPGIALGALAIPANLACAPPLMMIAAVSLLRAPGVIGDREAVALPIAASLAGLAGATTTLLWGIGFDEADAGRPPLPGSGILILATVIVAWALASGVIAAVLAAILRGQRRPSGERRFVGGLVGAVAAPALGVALAQPAGAVVVTGGMLAVALTFDRWASWRSVPPRGTDRQAASAEPDAVAFRLALFGAAGSVAAVVFAFAAGPVHLFGLDGTGAIGVGLGAGALAGIPVVIATARLLPRVVRPEVAALATAGLLTNVVSRSGGPFAGGALSFAALGISAALLCTAAAVAPQPWLPGSRSIRVALGTIAVAAATMSFGLVASAILGFTVPVVAAVVAVRARRGRRSPRSAAPAATHPS